MKETDRMRLLVCDCIDTIGRMNDKSMLESGKGIAEHLEELILEADEDRQAELMASALVVVLSVLKPLSEQLLASTAGRYTRSRIDLGGLEGSVPH